MYPVAPGVPDFTASGAGFIPKRIWGCKIGSELTRNSRNGTTRGKQGNREA